MNSGILLFALLAMMSVVAAMSCGMIHPRTLDVKDVHVINTIAGIHVMMDGRYEVLWPEATMHWKSMSMGWAMAPGYIYIISREPPVPGDIVAMSNGKVGVSHQYIGNGTTVAKSGLTETGWRDEDYMFKYVGIIFTR